MGFGFSDILYSDNPNRRARAEQLKGDINLFFQEFKEQERSRQVLFPPFRSY